MIYLLLFIVLLLFLVLWFWNDHKTHSKCPPGPLRLPILGNILQIAKLSEYPGVAFSKLAKIYGDIVYVRMGFANAVVFNSFESIQQILTHELCQIRGFQMIPSVVNRNKGKNHGIIFSSGPVHTAVRGFTVRKLRDFGFGKSFSVDIAIKEEMDIFIDILKSQSDRNGGGGAVINNMHDLLFVAISRIVNRYTTGINYEYDDPRSRKLLKLSRDVFQSFNIGMSPSIAFPFLFDWFPTWCGKKKQTEAFGKLKDFFQELIDEKRAQAIYRSSSNSFLDEFLLKIEKDMGESDTPFTDEQLIMCLLDLLQAGSEGTSGTINFSILYMTIYQNIQEKVQKELDSNLAPSEPIDFSTIKKLPYTHATLMESVRYCSILPTNVPHMASEDFYFNGYLIKKGTYIIGNHYAYHFCEKTWGDPYAFRPERFLKEDGTMNNNINKLMPFGCGKRICIGMGLGERASFMFFANLLRNFKFEKVTESDHLSTVPMLGIIQAAAPYRAKVTPRC